jgi:glycosyltransferase involved in cell wall biosynthesis
LRSVLVVNTTEHGGVEEHVRDLGVGLQRSGDSVLLVCPPAPQADHLAATSNAAGLAVKRAQLGSNAARGGPYGAVQRLRAIFEATRPDVVHVHLPGYTGGRLAVLAARWARAGAIVCTSHLAPSGQVPLKIYAERQLLNLAVDRFLAVSEHSLERQVRHLGQPRSKSAVVHNGVDFGRFAETADSKLIRQEIGLPEGAIVVGTVARLTEQKSLDTLIEALPEIVARHPQVHAVIVGDGPLRGRLTGLAETLGVAPRVHFLGFRSDVARCLGTFDVFVLPSILEGLPISILEAMACGLPVVATNVDGTPEAVVDGVTGRLVVPRRPRQLAEALLELLSDPVLARSMGAAGGERAHREFGMDRFIRATRAQYMIALSRRGHSAGHDVLPGARLHREG